MCAYIPSLAQCFLGEIYAYCQGIAWRKWVTICMGEGACRFRDIISDGWVRSEGWKRLSPIVALGYEDECSKFNVTCSVLKVQFHLLSTSVGACCVLISDPVSCNSPDGILAVLIICTSLEFGLPELTKGWRVYALLWARTCFWAEYCTTWQKGWWIL